MSVHAVRLEEFQKNIYRGDVFSEQVVIPSPQSQIKVELVVQKYTFTATEGYFELHPDASKYAARERWRWALLDILREEMWRVDMTVGGG